MRNPETLISILEEMSKQESGRIAAPLLYGGMGADKHHHCELLVDAGHAEWVGGKDEIVRITNDGYDFLNAVKAQPAAKDKFLEWFIEQGLPYAEAALRTVEMVKDLMPSS